MSIFDLTDMEDIPEEIKEGINVDEYAGRIVDLFEIAGRELSVDEITVAYYRRYKDVDSSIKTKRQIMSKLYNMARERSPRIISVEGKKGIYALKEGKEKSD